MHQVAESSSRGVRVLVAILLLLALGVRLAWGLSRSTDADALANLPDQREYFELAKSLKNDGRLAMVDPRFNDLVYAFRMPGYPAFGAALGANVTAIRVTQAILDASIVLAVYWLARRWLSLRVSAIAALFVAFDPIGVYFSGLILSETLFAALLTWGVACLARGTAPTLRGPRASHVVWLVGASLLLASIYVRPSALLFPTLIVGLSLWMQTTDPFAKPGRRLPALTLTALTTIAILVPWAIRNQTVVGKAIFTTTNDGFTLYDGLNPDADGSSDQSWVTQLPLLSNLSETQRSAYLRDRALDWGKTHPWQATKLALPKIARTWSPVPLSAEYGSKRLYVVVAALHAVPLMLLAVVGLFNRNLRRSVRLYLIAPAILITVMQAISVGSMRYRMPIHPMLAVLAAAAFVRPPRIVPARVE